jgi:hypothetical protein
MEATIGPEGDIEFEAGFAARLFGAEPARFAAALRAGEVKCLVERGEGEDAGRLRATLRWRGAEARVVLDGSGRALAVEDAAERARALRGGSGPLP